MKWVFRLIGGVILLVIVIAAIMLVSAHLQVRSVTPVLPTQGALLALNTVSDGPTKVSYIRTSSQKLERGQISHVSILVEWASGKSFLIDTGMSEKEALNFAELLKKMDATAGAAEVHGTIAQLLGANINNVAGVGFTHLHIDHTQGIENFCKAKDEKRSTATVVLQTPSQQNLHNFNTTEGADLVSSSCLEQGGLSSNESAVFTDRQFPGIAAIELGGHTPGSTLWAVSLANKILLFSGDITNDKHSLDHDVAKPAIYSYLIVPESTKRTAELRAWLKQLDQSESFSVIVSHDVASAQAHLFEFKL